MPGSISSFPHMPPWLPIGTLHAQAVCYKKPVPLANLSSMSLRLSLSILHVWKVPQVWVGVSPGVHGALPSGFPWIISSENVVSQGSLSLHVHRQFISALNIPKIPHIYSYQFGTSGYWILLLKRRHDFLKCWLSQLVLKAFHFVPSSFTPLFTFHLFKRNSAKF